MELRRQQSSPVQLGKFLVFVCQLMVQTEGLQLARHSSEPVSDLRYLLTLKCYDSPAPKLSDMFMLININKIQIFFVIHD